MMIDSDEDVGKKSVQNKRRMKKKKIEEATDMKKIDTAIERDKILFHFISLKQQF